MMTRKPDEAEGNDQRYRRPTRSLCCCSHRDHRRRGFFSSPVALASRSTLLAVLLFLCFFVSNTSSFAASPPTSYTANLGMKNAFLRTPGGFTRSPRQRSQEGTKRSPLSMGAMPSRPVQDDGNKTGGAEGVSGRGAGLERVRRAGSVVVLLQEALFSARRRVPFVSRWSSSTSSSSSSSVGSPPPIEKVLYLHVCEQQQHSSLPIIRYSHVAT